MPSLKSLKRSLLVAVMGFTALITCPSHAVDLGIEGVIYEPLEEDLRIMMMRTIAQTDWAPHQQDLEFSAKEYTKNLPSYYLPRAEKTVTRWKDVGIVTTEQIDFPIVDFENGSVFDPKMQPAVGPGEYFNPIAHLPSGGIDRLFIFDATDPEQLAQAKTLMRMKIPLLNFMTISGDLGPISEEMGMPLFHPIPTMLEKFHIRAVPTLIGFGRNEHQGHMAITEFALPVSAKDIQDAWFGYGDQGIPVNFAETPVRVQLADTPNLGEASP